MSLNSGSGCYRRVRLYLGRAPGSVCDAVSYTVCRRRTGSLVGWVSLGSSIQQDQGMDTSSQNRREAVAYGEGCWGTLNRPCWRRHWHRRIAGLPDWSRVMPWWVRRRSGQAPGTGSLGDWWTEGLTWIAPRLRHHEYAWRARWPGWRLHDNCVVWSVTSFSSCVGRLCTTCPAMNATSKIPFHSNLKKDQKLQSWEKSKHKKWTDRMVVWERVAHGDF